MLAPDQGKEEFRREEHQEEEEQMKNRGSWGMEMNDYSKEFVTQLLIPLSSLVTRLITCRSLTLPFRPIHTTTGPLYPTTAAHRLTSK
jgi:hypothetical protein